MSNFPINAYVSFGVSITHPKAATQSISAVVLYSVMITSRLKFPIAQDGILQLRLGLIEFDRGIKLHLTRILIYWTNGKALFLEKLPDI